MCTVLLSPGVNPIAVNKYMSYPTISEGTSQSLSSALFPVNYPFHHYAFGRNLGLSDIVTGSDRLSLCSFHHLISQYRSTEQYEPIFAKFWVGHRVDLLTVSLALLNTLSWTPVRNQLSQYFDQIRDSSSGNHRDVHSAPVTSSSSFYCFSQPIDRYCTFCWKRCGELLPEHTVSHSSRPYS